MCKWVLNSPVELWFDSLYLDNALLKIVRTSFFPEAQKNFDSYPGAYRIQRIHTPVTERNQTITVNWEQTHYDSYEGLVGQYVDWLELKNAFSIQWGGVLFGQVAYYLDFPYQSSLSMYRGKYFTEYEVGTLFNCLHRWTAYGHILVDFLPVLVLVSPNLRSNSYFLVPQRSKVLLNLYALAGVAADRVLMARPGEIFRAKRMYMMRPLLRTYMHGYSLVKVRTLVLQKLGLMEGTPWRYIIYDRRKNRMVENIRELDLYLSSAFPKIKFDWYRDEQRLKLPEQQEWAEKIYLYRQFLFLFGMHGSGSMNAMFMHTGSVFCIIETEDSRGRIFMTLSRLFGIHGYFTRDNLFGHFVEKGRLRFRELKIFELVHMAVTKAIQVSAHWVTDEVSCDLSIPMLGDSIW